MRDFRKFCRPRTVKYPKFGDVQIKLKCGEIINVAVKEYKKLVRFFKLDSVVGTSPNSPGNVIVYDSDLGQDIIISSETYDQNKTKFESYKIVGNNEVPTEGDIICYNSKLDKTSIFSFKDWLEVGDEWDLVGLYGITTYEEEDAVNGDYVIMANGHTLIIKPEDYSKVSDNWEIVEIHHQLDPQGGSGLIPPDSLLDP